MISKTNRLFAGILLVCFSVFLVPGEFVHALYGHEDTHHGLAWPVGKTAIDERHVHCAFLTYDAPQYTSSPVVACHFYLHAQLSVFCAGTCATVQLASLRTSLRGPPQA